ncbi:MAG: hypothetical protein ACOZAN_02525 [Patescibacteria group bacterium]
MFHTQELGQNPESIKSLIKNTTSLSELAKIWPQIRESGNEALKKTFSTRIDVIFEQMVTYCSRDQLKKEFVARVLTHFQSATNNYLSVEKLISYLKRLDNIDSGSSANSQ